MREYKKTNFYFLKFQNRQYYCVMPIEFNVTRREALCWTKSLLGLAGWVKERLARCAECTLAWMIPVRSLTEVIATCIDLVLGREMLLQKQV